MKFSLKTLITLMSIVLIVLLVYTVTLPWNPYINERKTSAFLEKVQMQKFEEASNLYGGRINKEAWVDQMQKLYTDEGFKLLSYDNVKVKYDDGAYNTGHVYLTFELDGKPFEVRATLTFASMGKPKQICTILPAGTKGYIPELEMWNKLVCGG